MTNAVTSTPPAGQPPVASSAPPATQEFSDRWDWLRIGIFFWGMVFLLSLVLTTFYNWLLQTNLIPYSQGRQTKVTFSIVELVLPAALLIAGSTLWDRTFWGANGRTRLWATGRLALALGVVGSIAGFALVFNDQIHQAFQSPFSSGYDFGVQLSILGTAFLLSSIEHGFVSGVALAFVFRRLSQRMGRARLVGVLGATLITWCAIGLYDHIDTLLLWATTAWMFYIRDPHHILRCVDGAGAGCFAAQAQMWVVTSALPLLPALLLGAFIGALLAYPYGERDSHVSAAGGNAGASAQPAPTVGRHRFWWALGRVAGSFAAGLLVTAAWLYVTAQALSRMGRATPIIPVVLTVIELLPFGILVLIGAIRLTRMPRERRPSAWRIGALAIVIVLGLAPVIVPTVFLQSVLLALTDPNTRAFGGSMISYPISLGALLALWWSPATMSSIRRILTTALAGWLGFALPLLVVAADAAYQHATFSSPNQATCHDLGCAIVAYIVTASSIELGLIAVFVGLPFMFLGVWMGSWLLQRGTLSRARDAVA